MSNGETKRMKAFLWSCAKVRVEWKNMIAGDGVCCRPDKQEDRGLAGFFVLGGVCSFCYDKEECDFKHT
jgi:hypothetical protein